MHAARVHVPDRGQGITLRKRADVLPRQSTTQIERNKQIEVICVSPLIRLCRKLNQQSCNVGSVSGASITVVDVVVAYLPSKSRVISRTSCLITYLPSPLLYGWQLSPLIYVTPCRITTSHSSETFSRCQTKGGETRV